MFSELGLKYVLKNILNVYVCILCYLLVVSLVLFLLPLIVQNNEVHYAVFMLMNDDHVLPLYFPFSKAICNFILWK